MVEPEQKPVEPQPEPEPQPAWPRSAKPRCAKCKTTEGLLKKVAPNTFFCGQCIPYPSYHVAGCAKCGTTGGTLHRVGDDYVCATCAGQPVKLRRVECPRCGKVLLEEQEGGAKSIACSIVSRRRGGILCKCSCGGSKRLRSGRL